MSNDRCVWEKPKDLRPERFPLWPLYHLLWQLFHPPLHRTESWTIPLHLLDKILAAKQWLLIHMKHPSFPVSGTSWTLTDIPPPAAKAPWNSPFLLQFRCFFTLPPPARHFQIKSYLNGALVDFLLQVGNTLGIQWGGREYFYIFRSVEINGVGKYLHWA